MVSTKSTFPQSLGFVNPQRNVLARKAEDAEFLSGLPSEELIPRHCRKPGNAQLQVATLQGRHAPGTYPKPVQRCRLIYCSRQTILTLPDALCLLPFQKLPSSLVLSRK